MSTAAFPLPAELYFRIRNRAITFAAAQDSDFALEVLRVSPAKYAEVQKFGTPDSTTYAQVLVRAQMSPSAVAEAVKNVLQSDPTNEAATAIGRMFWEAPQDFRIVCTPTNVIYHERLFCDISCGSIGRTNVPRNTEPIIPPATFMAICNRASAFAGLHHNFSRADLLQVEPAAKSEIAQYGMAGSEAYGEVTLRLEHSPEFRESMIEFDSRQRSPNLTQVREFLDRPRCLRVVCTATDIVHHEWLQFK